MKVKVTFTIEADDPEHSTGVTTETYDMISEAVMEVGGEDLDFTKEDEDG